MIVVTGASGLLGAAIVGEIRSQGREIAGICHRHRVNIADAPMYSLDLTHHAATRELLTRLRPAGIVHCAAATNVDWCEGHPAEAERLNVDVSSGLADIASDLGSRFIYISTDAVFDGKTGNYSEGDAPCAVNVYAQSKLLGEREVLNRCPSSLVVRVNIFGWNAQSKQSFAEWVLGKLEAGELVPGFTDVRFAPLLVNDLAEMLLTLLLGTWSGIYHAASSDNLNKYEFAQTIARVFHFDPRCIQPSRLKDARLPAPRPLNTSLNSKKLESVLGRTMPTINEGIGRFLELRENGYVERLRTHPNRGRST